MSERVEHFTTWDEYWGVLLEDGDARFPSVVYGFENVSETNRAQSAATIPTYGGSYGFVTCGAVRIRDERVDWRITAEQWFALPSGFAAELEPGTRMAVMQRLGYRGIHALGGPVEERGRLRYIDGCSDTLLCAPPVLGDPCLNLLHFPPGIDQTEHTHPSTRAGIVARGRGGCITPRGKSPLMPGRIFYIPRDGRHRFRTGPDEVMDVIAYHPDSDWGPTHEEHPMVNRTWVDGEKIDNTRSVHSRAQVITGDAG